MGMCSGKVYCKIYRDKKYCKKSDAKGDYKECNCRHARALCQVSICGFSEDCPQKRFMEDKQCD